MYIVFVTLSMLLSILSNKYLLNNLTRSLYCESPRQHPTSILNSCTPISCTHQNVLTFHKPLRIFCLLSLCQKHRIHTHLCHDSHFFFCQSKSQWRLRKKERVFPCDRILKGQDIVRLNDGIKMLGFQRVDVCFSSRR